MRKNLRLLSIVMAVLAILFANAACGPDPTPIPTYTGSQPTAQPTPGNIGVNIYDGNPQVFETLPTQVYSGGTSLTGPQHGAVYSYDTMSAYFRDNSTPNGAKQICIDWGEFIISATWDGETWIVHGPGGKFTITGDTIQISMVGEGFSVILRGISPKDFWIAIEE